MRAGHEAEWGAKQDELKAALAEATEGLNIHLERAEDGSLPRFELKAKRVKDDRVVKGEG